MNEINENEKNDEYDLFISHYQYNGGQLALIIKLLLEKKDPELKIFLDVDSNMKTIHNLENFIKKSQNILLLITEGVFNRPFVQLELKSALKYNKNIITIWDKEHCPNFPKKENIQNDLTSILEIKAIVWNSEGKYRNLAIEEIIENMEPIYKYDDNYYLNLESVMILLLQNYFDKNNNENNTRPYSCPLTNCGKTFSRLEHINRHCSIHIRKYLCELCGKRFLVLDSLTQHKNFHKLGE